MNNNNKNNIQTKKTVEGKCPITHKNIRELLEPVCAPDGHTYEKTAIIRWLSQHGSSPITRLPMTIEQLYPNRIIQNDDTSNDTSNDNKIDEPEIDFILSAALDNSGSMGMEAEIVNSNGKREKHGLSQLDLAKHSLNTIVESMTSNQMFGLCIWSTSARIELPLTRMNQEGRIKAVNAIKKITTEGSTNLWDGIYTGCRLVDTPVTSSLEISRCVWVLSDGNPNYHPPQDYEIMINEYNNQYGSDRVIRTLGFGTQIDSALLARIAKYGNSSFSFIPDPGFVGTCMVHAFANSLSRNIAPEDNSIKLEREKFIECIEKILEICKQQSGRYSTISIQDGQLKMAKSCYDMYMLGLSSNTFMEDEINIALASTDNWQKWGGHYARSLLSAHVNRECNNFLDKSVQQYQHCHSPKWIKNRGGAHTIFKSLPAPKPTIHYGNSNTAPRLRNLASYSQQSNGCLHEDSEILLVDGRSIKCKNVLPGMEVVSYVINEGVVQKNTDSIECIVKTECNKKTFIQLPDSVCKITEWHPVILQQNHINGPIKLEFPINIGEVVSSVSKYVYTFVLKNRSHAISISDWPCITLGHNLKEGIAKHEFWGTNKVINCLKDFPGWESGIITLQNENFIRKIGPDGPCGEVLYISPILR